MLLPNFFSLLWNDRGVQIEAGGKADATQDQSEADMSTLGSSVSDPDLRASLSSTSDSLTLQDPGSSGSYYDRIRSFFSRMVHPVEESPDVFSSLKSVAGGLSAILKHCDRTMWCYLPIESLIPRAERLAESLIAPAPEGDVEEEERRMILKRKLDEALQDLVLLENQVIDTGFPKITDDVYTFTGLISDIRDAMMDYQVSLQQDICDKSCQLIGYVDQILLNGMDHAVEAGHCSGNRQRCMSGTMGDVLRQIEDWLEDEQGQPVFWLKGTAGNGKSTIAQTITEIAFADGKLGASFFCSRDFKDRRNIRAIFPTLAYQLAHRYPCFRGELLKLLRNNPDIGQEPLDSQMEKLLVGPSKVTQIQTLIIIDALDECEDQGPPSPILVTLSKYVDQIPNIKFFITGRYIPQIVCGFWLPSLSHVTKVFGLDEVDSWEEEADIRLFLNVRLTEFANARRDCYLPEGWPDPRTIFILCCRSRGSFMHASTFAKFITTRPYFPTIKLNVIISLPKEALDKRRTETELLEFLEERFREGHYLKDFEDWEGAPYAHWR